jgi:Fe-S-cluster containining protein
MDKLAVYESLDAIYRQLPEVRCKGLCQASCGPILMSEAEWQRIREAVGGKLPKMAEDLTCPLLVNGRCSVYDLRPIVCRLFGAVKRMKCQHGCKPSKWPTEAQEHGWMKAVLELSDGAVDGPAIAGAREQFGLIL